MLDIEEVTAYKLDVKVWGRRPHCVWLYRASWGIMSDNREEWEALYLNSLTLSTMWACSHNIPYNVSTGAGKKCCCWHNSKCFQFKKLHHHSVDQIKARVIKNNRRFVSRCVAGLAWDYQVSCGVGKQPLVFQTSRCYPFMWSYLFPFRIPCQANQLVWKDNIISHDQILQWRSAVFLSI